LEDLDVDVEDNIKIDIKIGHMGVDWNHLAPAKDK
jgi:hypothetical protein